MKPTEVLPFRQCSDISRTERFICVQPLSGYRMIQPEDDGYAIYLAPDASDDALGRALLEALDWSRFIPPPDEPELFKWERYVQCHRNWQRDFMRRYDYKTKRDAYKNTDWCRAKRSEGKISMTPHKRDKPEYFTGLPAEKTVIIPETRDAAAAGAALRLPWIVANSRILRRHARPSHVDCCRGIRAVTSTDGMTADFYPFDMSFIGAVATRIINEVKGVNGVVYDITSKPPGTIERE